MLREDLGDRRANWVLCGRATIRSYENRASFDLLKYVHDRSLVWPPEVPSSAAAAGDRGELADRFLGILFPGSCKPNWLGGIYGVSAESDSGSDYAVRFRRFRVVVFG